MKHPLILALAASLSFTASAADKEAPAKPAEAKPGQTAPNNAKMHEGVWKPIAAVLGGVRLEPSALKAITLKITGEKYEVIVEGEPESDKGTCALDTSTSPKRMTIKSTDGPNKGKTILAIYEMKDAGSMRVCYDMSGTDFPKEFKAPKGSQFYLAGYRRQKD